MKGPFKWSQDTILYDFKEVRNSLSIGTVQYDENGAYIDPSDDSVNYHGVCNVSKMIQEGSYEELSPSYNYKRTIFKNCDLTHIDGAEVIQECRIVSSSADGASPSITNAKGINGLSISIMPTNYSLALINCSNISNVRSNGKNIIYNNCTNIDFDTCNNAPEELNPYRRKIPTMANYYGANAIYAQQPNGKEVSMLARAESGGGFIPVRNGAGDLLVPYSPSSDNAAACKKYVDDKVPRIEVKTQEEYDALETKDETTIYIIKE